MPCMIGSMPEFGIGTAAQIHLGVAMTNLGPDSDTCGVLYHPEDLLKGRCGSRAASPIRPTGPGLGVEVDMDVVERWRRNAAAAATPDGPRDARAATACVRRPDP